MRVHRPTINANIRTKPTPLDKALAGIVATLAQAHERAVPEFIDAAAMWLDMVADLGRGYDAALRAIAAERLLEQLVPADPRPPPGAVAGVPLRGRPRTSTMLTPSSARLMALQSTQQSMFDCTPSAEIIVMVKGARTVSLTQLQPLFERTFLAAVAQKPQHSELWQGLCCLEPTIPRCSRCTVIARRAFRAHPDVALYTAPCPQGR